MQDASAGARPPVFVTGATSGIGLAVSALLGGEGFRVLGGVLPGQDATALERAGATLVSLDVTDAVSLAAARDEVTKRLHPAPLWGLVNCAGTVGAGPVELSDLEEARRVFEVNALGLLAATQTFLPQIRRARGRIVNLSSLSALLSLPFMGAYCASKSAVESLSDSLRRELAPFGVEVVVIQPGTTRTPLWRAVDRIDLTPFRGSGYEAAVQRVRAKAVRKGERGLDPAEVARAVLRALTAARPPTRIRVQRRRAARLRYRLLPLLPDRLVDRLVAEKVWGAAAPAAKPREQP